MRRTVSVRSQEFVNIDSEVPNRSTQPNECRAAALVPPRSKRRHLQAQAAGRFHFGERSGDGR
jgi:hypothetical protein